MADMTAVLNILVGYRQFTETTLTSILPARVRQPPEHCKADDRMIAHYSVCL